MLSQKVFGLWAAAVLAYPSFSCANPSFQQIGSTLVMSNASVQLDYNLNTGTTDFYWNNNRKVTGFYSGVGLNSGYVTGLSFSNRTWSAVTSDQVAVTSHAGGLPDMIQYFTFDQSNSFLTRVEMSGANASANWMGPVVVDTSGGVDIGSYTDNRALFVPFDNDHFVSYNSESINGSDTGNEVGAFYDNASRNGLVVGSVTHDVWKTGVYWAGSNNKLNQLNVFGGVTSYWTWDVMPHGFVSGNRIASPTVFVGFGTDWRTTMENFADENALFTPRLKWTNGVPFGWNSWGVSNYQNNITYAGAIAVSDSIHTNLQNCGFTNEGTVYVNLDSYWDNLNSTQLQSFVSHCHANGQKAGVYWAPFVFWGTLAQSSNWNVPGSNYFYSDIMLRTTNGSDISNDGGIALDPTHPGTKALIQYEINVFTNYGFDYIKLDFLSHGSLEGVHYDTNATTGIEAYNEGMQYLLNAIGGRMFISESIAPLFPYQYGHSRRIACDAGTSEIGNTAYTMNAVSCGWWIGGRLYEFNDPDLMVFDNGPDTNEDQSRLINCAITGVFLNGSILTNGASISLAQMCLTNSNINAVARLGQTFRPVDGASGTGAANIFAQQSGANWLIAVFNYTSNATNEPVSLSSAGLTEGAYYVTDLWSGITTSVTNSFNVSLNEKQAKLFVLASQAAASRPVIGSISLSSSNLALAGSNGVAGGRYSILTATEITASLSNWIPLSTNNFDLNGNFTVTTPINPRAPQSFYMLKR